MNWVETSYYVKLPSGPTAQGDIWNNLPRPFYKPPQCHGIIITPRCDLRHDKAQVINFLPILPLYEFMSVYGGFSLIEQEIHKAREAQRNAAAPLKVGALLDLEIPTSAIYELLNKQIAKEPDPKSVSRFTQLLLAFTNCSERLDQLVSQLDQVSLKEEAIAELIPDRSILKYKRDIIQNRIADLHFLPPYDPFLADPSVVLLRHVVTCNIKLLNQASKCMNQDHWTNLRASAESMDSEFAPRLPERLLRFGSPYFECLMSRFASLFGRVGVRDFDDDQVTTFVKAERSEPCG